MKKNILLETHLFEGEVEMPKHYEIDRYQIKSEILHSQLHQKTISSNPYHYAFVDYEVPTPDYIMIYGIDVDKNSSVIVETKDKRGVEQLSPFKIQNNHFLLFPSYLKFFINENNSHQTNVFLTTTYVII